MSSYVVPVDPGSSNGCPSSPSGSTPSTAQTVGAISMMCGGFAGVFIFEDPGITNAQASSRCSPVRPLPQPDDGTSPNCGELTPTRCGGKRSLQFGDVPSSGWGSGRTGEHRDEAWALVIPGSSKMKTPVKPPHIMDIAPTVCAVLGVDPEGLDGQPLLEPGSTGTTYEDMFPSRGRATS